MAIAFEGYDYVQASGNMSGTITIPANTDYAVCAIQGYDNASFTSVSIDGTAMSLIDSNSGTSVCFLYGLVSPTTGASVSVASVSGAWSEGVTYMFAFFSGVDQTTPIRDSTAQDADSGVSSAVLSCATGDHAFISGFGNTPPTLTDNSQTLIVDSIAYRSQNGGCSRKAITSGTTTTVGTSGNNYGTMVAVILIEASSGTVYNVSCSDSLSLSDLFSMARIIAMAVSDFVSMTDVIGSSAIISGALSDVVDLSDASTLARSLNLSASDGLALADLSGTALALNLSASELITFSDAVTAITNINATLSDIAHFIDSVAASSFAPISVSCSDGLLLADSVQGALSLDLTAIDGLELTDASGSTITFNVQCPDGIELSDFASAALIILGSCVDGLTLTDLAQETSFLPQGMVRIVGTGKAMSITGEGHAYKVIFDIVKRPKITGGN